ncbi:MAG: signal peptidase II, partial [Alphaproteobacteria bacterium]|nr:signal peptidase II [Alphaproteobacteria bacterium]
MQKTGALAFSFIVILLDQLSKWAVTEHIIRPLAKDGGLTPVGLLEWYTNPPPPLSFASQQILPFLNLVMIWNRGISFGIFAGANQPYLLAGISIIICLLLLSWLGKINQQWLSASIGLVIGGALGNIVDRIRFG